MSSLYSVENYYNSELIILCREASSLRINSSNQTRRHRWVTTPHTHCSPPSRPRLITMRVVSYQEGGVWGEEEGEGVRACRHSDEDTTSLIH